MLAALTIDALGARFRAGEATPATRRGSTSPASRRTIPASAPS